MNTIEMFRELENFYSIRQDNYGKGFVTKFVNRVTEEKVEPENMESFYHRNKEYFCEHYSSNTVVQYQGILFQFIRYLQLTRKVTTFQNKQSSSRRKPTKIYDSFYKLQQTTSEKLDS